MLFRLILFIIISGLLSACGPHIDGKRLQDMQSAAWVGFSISADSDLVATSSGEELKIGHASSSPRFLRNDNSIGADAPDGFAFDFMFSLDEPAQRQERALEISNLLERSLGKLGGWQWFLKEQFKSNTGYMNIYNTRKKVTNPLEWLAYVQRKHSASYYTLPHVLPFELAEDLTPSERTSLFSCLSTDLLFNVRIRLIPSTIGLNNHSRELSFAAEIYLLAYSADATKPVWEHRARGEMVSLLKGREDGFHTNRSSQKVKEAWEKAILSAFKIMSNEYKAILGQDASVRDEMNSY